MFLSRCWLRCHSSEGAPRYKEIQCKNTWLGTHIHNYCSFSRICIFLLASKREKNEKKTKIKTVSLTLDCQQNGWLQKEGLTIIESVPGSVLSDWVVRIIVICLVIKINCFIWQNIQAVGKGGTRAGLTSGSSYICLAARLRLPSVGFTFTHQLNGFYTTEVLRPCSGIAAKRYFPGAWNSNSLQFQCTRKDSFITWSEASFTSKTNPLPRCVFQTL